MVHGKMGCVMASYLKVLPMWLIVFPGMIARILYPNDVACNELDTCERSCQRESGCHDIAYPLLVVRVGATEEETLLFPLQFDSSTGPDQPSELC